MSESPADATRVLHLITCLDVGGAETMLLKLVQKMDRGKFSSCVACLTAEGVIGQHITRAGIPVVYLNMPRGRVTFRGLSKLLSLAKAFRPHLLQTWLYHSDLIGLLVGRLLGVRTILWNLRCAFIDLERYRISTRLVLHLCRRLSSLPEAIVSNSQEAIRYHKALGYRNRSWHLIPNGVDPALFAPDANARPSLVQELGIGSRSLEGLGPDEAPVLIGCVARFDPMKDHATLIEAAKRVLEQRRNVVFVLVGRDVEWRQPFFDRAIPEHWRPFFHLLGERGDIARIMAALDIFLLTSYGEGFPNVLCEAMAAGVPCVATDVGDCRKVIGPTGLVTEPKNPRQIGAAVLKLCAMSQQQRNRMGLEARQRVLDHYTINAVAKQYASLYERYRPRPGHTAA